MMKVDSAACKIYVDTSCFIIIHTRFSAEDSWRDMGTNLVTFDG